MWSILKWTVATNNRWIKSLKRFSSTDLGEILVRALCANFYAKHAPSECCCFGQRGETEIKQKKVSVLSFKFNVAYKYIITRYIKLVSTKITSEPFNGSFETEHEKQYETRQYANYIPYDETCILKSEGKFTSALLWVFKMPDSCQFMKTTKLEIFKTWFS